MGKSVHGKHEAAAQNCTTKPGMNADNPESIISSLRLAATREGLTGQGQVTHFHFESGKFHVGETGRNSAYKMDPVMATTAFTLEGIQKFHGWTHASLNLLLDHLSTIPSSDYLRELPNFGFPTLRSQVIHIFNCEGFWIHVLQGLPYVDCNPAECPSPADARLLQQQVSQQTQAYLSSLTDQQLNSNAELYFPDGDIAVRTPSLVLHHVLTHAFHHKGQIVAMCRTLGYPAPDTDMNHFS